MSTAAIFESLLGLAPGDEPGTLHVRRGVKRLREGVLLYVPLRVQQPYDVVEPPDELVRNHCYAAFLLNEEFLGKLSLATSVAAEQGFDRVDFTWAPVELEAVAGRIEDIAWSLQVVEDLVKIRGEHIADGSCSVDSCNFISIPTVAAALCSKEAEGAPGFQLLWRAQCLLKGDPEELPVEDFEQMLLIRSAAFAARTREHLMRNAIDRHPWPSVQPRSQGRNRRVGI